VPVFCIEITGVQLDVLVKIKEFLERSLGFDRYSLYKLKNSSFITVTTVKARNNSKSSVALTVKNIRVLNNYLVPFLDNMTFLTPARGGGAGLGKLAEAGPGKKGQDFNDFKIICGVVYKGASRKDDIKNLILKLSYTMNNYRLSTNIAPPLGLSLSKDEKDKLIFATPVIEYLPDGRARDIITRKVIHQQTSCVYEIGELDGEVLMANTLSEAASLIGVYPDTLSKYLDIDIQDSVENWVTLNNHKIRRVPVFNPFA
jgi:hypothetical protein